MTDFLTGSEGLDDVLMKLAERWDTLSEVQKRYGMSFFAKHIPLFAKEEQRCILNS